MIELQQVGARAAIGALADTLAAVEGDLKATKYVTVEVELAGGKPTSARAWVERKCNINRLLGVSGRR